jgi:hypothetical protein
MGLRRTGKAAGQRSGISTSLVPRSLGPTSRATRTVSRPRSQAAAARARATEARRQSLGGEIPARTVEARLSIDSGQSSQSAIGGWRRVRCMTMISPNNPCARITARGITHRPPRGPGCHSGRTLPRLRMATAINRAALAPGTPTNASPAAPAVEHLPHGLIPLLDQTQPHKDDPAPVIGITNGRSEATQPPITTQASGTVAHLPEPRPRTVAQEPNTIRPATGLAYRPVRGVKFRYPGDGSAPVGRRRC